MKTAINTSKNIPRQGFLLTTGNCFILKQTGPRFLRIDIYPHGVYNTLGKYPMGVCENNQ